MRHLRDEIVDPVSEATLPSKAVPFLHLIQQLVARFGVVLGVEHGIPSVGILGPHRRDATRIAADFAKQRGATLERNLAPHMPTAQLRSWLGAQSASALTLKLEGGHVLEIDFWRVVGDSYVNPRNRLLAKRLARPSDQDNTQIFVPSRLFALEMLHRKNGDRAPRFEVDLVYTWVDDTDPAWRRLYNQYAQTAPTVTGTRSALFRSSEELRFSLRSLVNAPWIRRVFLVTNCAPPPWLNLSTSRLSVVSHERILPAAGLPTFNSHAIEACLHRIPDLAQHFVYLNDDMFFLNPTDASDFFFANGVTKSFLEPYGMVLETPPVPCPDYLAAALNGKHIIEDLFDMSPTQLHEHVPYALNRAVLEELEERLPDQFATTRTNRFRSHDDISVTSFLYHHYAFCVRQAIPSTITAEYVIKTKDWRARLRRMERSRAKVVCVNDSDTKAVDQTAWSTAIRSTLLRRFPSPSEFERD